MTFREAETLFHNQLIDLYPTNEADAIVYLVFGSLFGVSRFQLHLKANNNIPEKSVSQIYDIIYQLKQHKPIQYILGETEFYGMSFKVDQSVLIPRPETEELVQWIINDNKDKEDCSILDIGTGSGCIAVSLAKNIASSKVYAIDISKEAINTAQFNANSNSVEIILSVADILHSPHSIDEKFDVIVSNPPYITIEQKADMVRNVTDFEPHIALFAPDANSFVFYEAISSFAKDKLKPDGYLYFEINEKYPDETAMRINKYGFSTEVRRDINNKFRMIKAWKNG